MAPACQLHMQACPRSLVLLSEVNAPCGAPAPIGERPTRCKPWCGTFLPAALQPASTGDRRIPSEAQGHRDRTASSRNESKLASAQTLMQISKKEERLALSERRTLASRGAAQSGFSQGSELIDRCAAANDETLRIVAPELGQ